MSYSPEFQQFLRLHSDLPRQGPGSDETTMKALKLLPSIPPNAVIYDLGCGIGRASIILAKSLKSKIIAIDSNKDSITQLKETAAKQHLSELIDARCDYMTIINEIPESIDLIWSEGAIYCIGFDNGLETWRTFLRPKGIIACTELSWLTDQPSNEAIEFWQSNYPEMRSVTQNIHAVQKLGYKLLDHFTLPDSCWWDEYYNPMLKKIEHLTPESKTNTFLAGAIANSMAEIDLYRDHGKEYGYEFYLMQKSHDQN